MNVPPLMPPSAREKVPSLEQGDRVRVKTREVQGGCVLKTRPKPAFHIEKALGGPRDDSGKGTR